MTGPVAILGAATRVGTDRIADLEGEVRAVVAEALAAAGVSLEEIDAVVTCASDTLDGVMVPIRAEIAGSFGKSCMNVPSSAGHAVSAAMVLIESGQAERVLLAGWGAAGKFGVQDTREIQADPFHDRRVGATPAGVAELQAAELHAAFPDLPAHTVAFADGAVALVLGRGAGAVYLSETGTASRGYYPEDDGIDPALWVAEALAEWRTASGPSAGVAVSGPGRTCEARAVAALSSGGAALATGSAAGFGPATALHQLAALHERLSGTAGEGVLLDLAGPMGQHVTALRLAGGAA